MTKAKKTKAPEPKARKPRASRKPKSEDVAPSLAASRDAAIEAPATIDEPGRKTMLSDYKHFLTAYRESALDREYWERIVTMPKFKAKLDEIEAGIDISKEEMVEADKPKMIITLQADVRARRLVVAEFRLGAFLAREQDAARELKRFEGDNPLFVESLSKGSKPEQDLFAEAKSISTYASTVPAADGVAVPINTGPDDDERIADEDESHSADDDGDHDADAADPADSD